VLDVSDVYMYQNFTMFLISHLQGSVATYIRFGGTCGKGFIANFLLNLAVKDFFFKSVNICLNYA